MPPYDALLGTTGPAATPGTAIEASAVTADGDGTKGYVYIGKNMSVVADCRIAGAFDRTSSDETLAFEVHEATDAAGTGAALIASSATLSANHAVNLGSSAANGKNAGTLSDGPTRVGFSTGTGGYVKIRFNVSGTTPSAAGLSADFRVLSNGVQRSGV